MCRRWFNWKVVQKQLKRELKRNGDSSEKSAKNNWKEIWKGMVIQLKSLPKENWKENWTLIQLKSPQINIEKSTKNDWKVYQKTMWKVYPNSIEKSAQNERSAQNEWKGCRNRKTLYWKRMKSLPKRINKNEHTQIHQMANAIYLFIWRFA